MVFLDLHVSKVSRHHHHYRNNECHFTRDLLTDISLQVSPGNGYRIMLLTQSLYMTLMITTKPLSIEGTLNLKQGRIWSEVGLKMSLGGQTFLPVKWPTKIAGF